MKLLLIDGNSLLFRAYYATAYAGVDKIMRTSNGFPTNGLYGLANLVTKILSNEQPDYALVAFDTSKPTFRHLEYAEYKAGRQATPEELKQQFLPAREMLKKMGLFVYEIEGYEADDIIGTTSLMAPKDCEVEIYSADKDLLQLIGENCKVCLTKKGVTDLKIMSIESLKEEMGITPIQITDLKGLMGDSSDNIPGINGVGEKTAVKLLDEYQTVENIVEADIPGKLGEKIKECKEQALKSKKLATINREVPVEYKFDELKYNGVTNELSAFFKGYEMYSLEKRLVPNSVKETIKIESEKVSEVPADFLTGELALVFEINGSSYHKDEIIGLGLSNGNKCYFVSPDDIANDKELINYLKSDVKKIGFDIKKIKCIFNRLGITINNLSEDVLLGTYLLETQLKDDPGIFFNYYDLSIAYKSDVFKKGTPIKDIYEYIANEAICTYKAFDKMIKLLKDNDLYNLYKDVELPLALILADMEINGIKVDTKLLKEKETELKAKLADLTTQIYECAGHEYNINSPAQTAVVLFDELQLPANKKRSTSAEELDFLKQFHPLPGLILKYRELFKLLSGYYEGLQEYVLSDGKIHTIYNQALTQTGRLSSRDPNLQNISVRSEEGKEVRKVFICDDDSLLISFDYSQIELRVLADMANADSLKQAFINKVDVHTDTAKRVFGISENEVTEEKRRQAKVVNFGIMYGMSDFELARELGIGFNQAKEFMLKYFETYPEVQNYFKGLIDGCIKDGYVKTKFGRIRKINEVRSSVYLERERGKRMAMNAPIQGTAADIMKMQMIKVDKAIKDSKLDIKMLLQVHDEIVLEIKEKDLEAVINLIKTTMEDFDLIDVPLVVDYHYGKNWME